METKSCPACRSVNHSGIPRCMNCGAPMEVPVLPQGISLDDLPPAPPPPQDGYGFTAMVSASPRARKSTSVAIVLGIVAVATYVVTLVMMLGSQELPTPTTGMLAALTVVWAITLIFWLWMLIDAISDSRIGWALLIFFLGVIPALCYALFGRVPRTASY